MPLGGWVKKILTQLRSAVLILLSSSRLARTATASTSPDWTIFACTSSPTAVGSKGVDAATCRAAQEDRVHTGSEALRKSASSDGRQYFARSHTADDTPATVKGFVAVLCSEPSSAITGTSAMIASLLAPVCCPSTRLTSSRLQRGTRRLDNGLSEGSVRGLRDVACWDQVERSNDKSSPSDPGASLSRAGTSGWSTESRSSPKRVK